VSVESRCSYAKRVVGTQGHGGQSTHLPLRVNAGGVMPVIFASSILTLPQTIGYGLRDNRYFSPLIQSAGAGASRCTRCCTRSGSFSFAYFYVSIVFNPARLPTTCGSTEGHPWHPSWQAHRGLHLTEVLTHITLVGAFYLIIISFIPEWMITVST